MVGFYRNLACAACLAGTLIVVSPLATSATVSDGCKASGTATISGTTDLTSADVWHLKTSDEVTGTTTYQTQT